MQKHCKVALGFVLATLMQTAILMGVPPYPWHEPFAFPNMLNYGVISIWIVALIATLLHGIITDS